MCMYIREKYLVVECLVRANRNYSSLEWSAEFDEFIYRTENLNVCINWP